MTTNKLYNEWNKRWTNNENKNLTFIGKKMLKAKQQTLQKEVKKLNPKSIIDVGCAMGYTLSTLQKINKNTIGIDISNSAINICKKKNLNATQKNIKNIQEKYELVFSDGMLEHFLNFEPITKELIRISKKYVIITQTNHESFLGKTSIYLAELLRKDKNVFEYNYRINDFISVFEKHNFKCISNKPIFFNIFRILIFEKNEKP